MGQATPPINDYTSLVELSGRIHKFLQAHPGDTQALNDLHYVAGMLKTATPAANAQDSPPPPSQHPKAEIASGLTQAALDIPKSILQTLTHPIRTAGQITGIGNAAAADAVLKDPEASIPEKLDAILRATPFNMGYAAERGLLNATGAKSDEPASLQEQAHAAGNVAGLALLGVNRNTPGVRLAGRIAGKIPVVGPLARAAGDVVKRYTPQESPQAAIQREMAAAPARPEVPLTLDQLRAFRDFEKGKIGGEDLRTALDYGRPGFVRPPADAPLPQGLLRPTPKPPPDALDIPTFMRQTTALRPENPHGLLAPTKAAERIMGKPGHPMWSGSGSPTTSAEVRGGEPLLPSANPEVAAMLQSTPFAKLQATLRLPETPQVVKNLILIEIQRRGIVGPGLLAPR